MWGAQRFHGPAPGKQTGSLGCDDYRNPRLPLPSRPGAGWSIGGGGMWCGPALVPRGIDPGLLGLPGGGGGAPLLGNPGGPAESMLSGAYERYQQFMTKMELETYYISTRTGPNRFVMPWQTLIPASQNGMSSPAPEENSGDGGGGNGNTDEQAPDTLWGKVTGFLSGVWNSEPVTKARDFISRSWDSPVGIAAGILVAVGTVIGLTVGAPLTIGILCGALAAGALAGTVTNLLMGAADVLWRDSGHQSLSDSVSPEAHDYLRLGRDIYQWAGVLGEAGILSGKLALELARGGTKLGIGGFSKWWKAGGGRSANFALREYNWFWERPTAIPANWKMKLGDYGNGLIVRHPSGNNNILRWMDPGSSGSFDYPRGYYRIQDKAGQFVDYMGNVAKDEGAAHIDGGIKLRDLKYPWA